MLRYQVRGENLEITQAIREYVENKVSKLKNTLLTVYKQTFTLMLKYTKIIRKN